ncbi:MAG: DoxX family membrane protein [Candidatus Saccharibacteria bacterium]
MKWKNSSWATAIWTLLRVYLGWNWLESGYGKVFGAQSAVWVGKKAGVAVTGFLHGALSKTSGPHPDVQWWYAWFVQHVALPNVKVFSYMVSVGELLVGLALIFGAFTTIALIGGVFMNLNYLFAGSVSVNPIFLIEEVILLWAGAAAYYWGVDRFLIPSLRERFLRKGLV